MKTEFDVRSDDTQVEKCLAEFRSLLDRLGSKLNQRIPEISGWSAAQHLYHVVLSTDLGLANVLSLCQEKGILIRPEGEFSPVAKAALLADSIPKGQVEAPRMVRPDEFVERESIETELTNASHTLAKIKPHLDRLEESPGWITHQVLGPMQANHWLRFCSLHASHHLTIVREIEAGLSK